MIPRRWAILIPIAALAACGGGTVRVAQDDGGSGGPVALAPAPEPESDSTAAPAPAPAPVPVRDTTPPTPAPSNAQGYAPYGTGSNLEIRRIGQWSHTGIGESRRMVIRDANAWAELWSELGTGDRPQVDFTRNVVIAVAGGQRPSGGYEIAVDRVSQADGELTVDVVETTPGPNCITSSSLTQPADVVVVPVVAPRSWSFMERKEVRSCR